MIYIAADNYNSAKYYIKYYGLKKNAAFKHFQMFEGGKAYLVVTGAGLVKAAVALTQLCEYRRPEKGDLLLCPGFADIRKISIANKITDMTALKDFYPDMYYRHDFDEINIFTTYSLGKRENGVSDTVSSGIFEAGSIYFDKGNMFFIKIPEEMADIGSICLWLDKISLLAEEENKPCLSESEIRFMNKAADLLKFTEYMKKELWQLVCYAKLTGKDAEKLLSYYCNAPAQSKTEGKMSFERLRKELIS